MRSVALNIVNTHYVDNVMRLAKTRKVVASNDIYDERGAKLVAKGTQIDPSMRERLVTFKLRQPLESSLITENGVSNKALLHEAEALLDEMPPLAFLLESTHSKNTALGILQELHLDSVSTLLLSIGECDGGESLRHSVQAALTAIALGTHQKLDRNALLNLGLAGLLHDVGELYIDPEIRSPDRPLTPDEWKHTAAHPRIGQLVIRETTQYPHAVSVAIDEHHERSNGFGYPRRLQSEGLSQLGKILLVSEVLCGIFTKAERVEERVSLAFKVIPGEYPPELVSLISSVYRDVVQPAEIASETIEQLAKRVARILQNINATLAPTDDPPAHVKADPAASKLLAQIRTRLTMLQRAMHATGLSGCGDPKTMDSDAGSIVREMEAVIHEIEWRLRELSRQVILDMLGLQQEQQQFLTILALCMAAD